MIQVVRFSTLLASGLILGAGAAPLCAATPARSGELLVEAVRTTGPEQRVVSIADLTLSDPSAHDQILRRVSIAIDSLCAGGDMGVTDPINAFKCNHVAWDSVKPQLAALLIR
jgi:UrcA family protein